MTYDPEARRDTPLALKLKARIERDGPITVADYMRACLQDPEHGYYVNEPAIGAAGDFITAPEISQVFGELLGLWAAVVWQQMGSPAALNLVELGPGRGTLMRDALRAIRKVAGLGDALSVTLAETSAPLRMMQKSALAASGFPITWVDTLASLPGGPTIVIANEFLDTCPVSQIEAAGGTWHQREVGLNNRGQLQFQMQKRTLAPEEVPSLIPSGPQQALLFERQDFGFYADLARARPEPFAALFIDYGHARAAPGETLQALRGHRAEHPLTSPGEADLTVHVCFEDFIAHVRTLTQTGPDGKRRASHEVCGPITQAEFLGQLGIVERASRLMSANPAKAAEIEASVARLIAPNGMGTRFKAIGIRSPGLVVLPGFARTSNSD